MVGKGGPRQMIQLGIKGGCIDEEGWRWSYLTVEMRLNCWRSVDAASLQHMLLAKISLDFKVLIILPWQSAKWLHYVDHKMSTRHTHWPYLAAFCKEWNNKLQESQTEPKMKTKPKGPSRWVWHCVSIWTRPFSNRSHDTLVPDWNSSHQVYGNKWFKGSNSLLFCMFKYL